MFASALQKRKAVALSQSQPQATQQAPQPQSHASRQQQQQQQNASLPASQTASSSSATATASAARPSLSDMLAKKQRTEAAPTSSRFTTARQLSSSSQQHQQQQVATAKATTAAKRAAPAKSRANTWSKARPQQQQSDEQEGVVFELSAKRRVTVRKWRAAVLIDIREYYDDDGVSKPGKKGISLAKEQWRTLQRLAPAIDEAIVLVEDDSVDEHSLQDVEERISADSNERTISFALSSKRRISVRFFRSGVLVDLREFYDQDGVQKPGKKGISLSKEQWRALCGAQQDVAEAASQL